MPVTSIQALEMAFRALRRAGYDTTDEMAQVAQTPASDVADIAAKLRLALDLLDKHSDEAALIRSALADLGHIVLDA